MYNGTNINGTVVNLQQRVHYLIKERTIEELKAIKRKSLMVENV